MNGNGPLLLHASVTPLRQAPCHGYSINYSIKHSNIHYFSFLSNIHMHTSIYVYFWKEIWLDIVYIIYIYIVYLMQFLFFMSPRCCNIGHTLLIQRRCIHAHENLKKDREITWPLSECQDLKGAVKSHICVFAEWWAWVSMSASLARNTTRDSLGHHSTTESDLKERDAISKPVCLWQLRDMLSNEQYQAAFLMPWRSW